LTHHHVAVVQGIGERSASFVGGHSFGATQLMKIRSHLFKVCRFAMIDNFHAPEIYALTLRSLSDDGLISK